MSNQCRNWQAWLNTMPPPPDELHVVGDVIVGNPGISAHLTMREPQGSNPAVLLLDLHLVQQPGMWLQVMTCVQARFDRVLTPESTRPTSVEIFQDGTRIVLIDTIDVVS